MNSAAVQRLSGRDCQLDLIYPCIMGVLNVTPDSFSDGGRCLNVEVAVQRGLVMQQEGAAVLDIGGESTRPGSLPVSAEEELARIIPVIEGLRQETNIPLSVDTSKSVVARTAIAAGANFINDISGLSFDPDMSTVAAETGAGLFLMHTSGRPEVMQQQTEYQNLLNEVTTSLQRGICQALAAGVESSRISVDPGIGFGKSVLGNLDLLHHLDYLHQLECPILLGTSRKSFIGEILDRSDPQQRNFGTLATIALGVSQGVQIFRVHDVLPARETALVAWAIREQKLP